MALHPHKVESEDGILKGIYSMIDGLTCLYAFWRMHFVESLKSSISTAWSRKSIACGLSGLPLSRSTSEAPP
jgi:hypothetical protein